MTHLLTLVALCGALPAAAGTDETTMGLGFEVDTEPGAHEARERARPGAKGARPTASRPAAKARPGGRSTARTAPSGHAARPTAPTVTGPRQPCGAPCGHPTARPQGTPTTVVTRPGAVVTRPGAVVTRPGAVVTRPGAVVTRPGAVVTRPGVVTRPLVVGRPVHSVRYSAVYPYHGVFVYGPRPTTHVTYVTQGPVQVRQRDLPKRAVDRDGSLAVGAAVGSVVWATPTGSHADPGVSLLARYRPDEALGLQLGVGHYNGAWSTEEIRSQTQLNGQLALFAFPWSKVSPYALAGATYNVRNVQSELLAGDLDQSSYSGGQVGLHGGVGLELSLSDALALDLQGKYIGWMGRELGEAPGSVLFDAGLTFHFR